jgi:hypothetical protein
MLDPTCQRSFSAKSPPKPRRLPPRKQKHDPAVREYLRPDEVEAMVQATRKSGRHRVRDAAIIRLLPISARALVAGVCYGRRVAGGCRGETAIFSNA